MKLEIYSHRMADDKDYYGLREVVTQRYVTPALYDDVVPLTESLFLCEANTRQGVLDATGCEVVPPLYHNLEPFDREATCFRAELDGRQGLVGRDGAVRVPFVYEELRYDAERGALLGWRDRDGEAELLPLPDGVGTCFPESEGAGDLSFVFGENAGGETCVGVQDRNGNAVVPCRYAEVRPLYCGYWLVRDHRDAYGVLGPSQEEVVAPEGLRHTPYYDTTWYHRSVSPAADDASGQSTLCLCLAHDRFRIGKQRYFICDRRQVVERTLTVPAGADAVRIFAAIEDEDEGDYPLEEYLGAVGPEDVVLDGRGNRVADIGAVIQQTLATESALRRTEFRDASGQLLGYDYLLPTGARRFHRLFHEVTAFRHGYARVRVDDRTFFIDEEGNEFDTLHDAYYHRPE